MKTDVKYVFAVSKIFYNPQHIDFNNLFSNFDKAIKSEEKIIKLYNPSEKRVIEVINIVDLKKGFNTNIQIKNLDENEIFFLIKINKTKNELSTLDDFNNIIEENIEASLDFLKKIGVIETKKYNTYILKYKLVNVIGYYERKVDIEKIMKKIYEIYHIKYKLCLRKSLIVYVYEKNNTIFFSKKKETNSIGSLKIFKDKFSLFINFDNCEKPMKTLDRIINKICEVIEEC